MANDETPIAAFSAEQIARLTGLSMRQLAAWDRAGFFAPHHADENRRTPYSRIYSFTDLVGLKTLAILTKDHRVTLPHLKKVAQRLSQYTDRPWSSIKLGVWKRSVQWIEPETGLTAGVLDHQYLMVEMADVWADMQRAVAQEHERKSDEYGQVSQHRHVVHNLQTIAGTRIPVRSVQAFLKAGYSVKAILEEYPGLKSQDIEAVMRLAQQQDAA